MKKINYIFITLVILTLFPATAIRADNKIAGQQPLSAGVLNPALIGIKAIRVAVFYQNAPIGLDDGFLADMRAGAERRLAESDRRLAVLLQEGFNARFLDPPLIRIDINKFFLIAGGPPVFSVQTTLFASVTVESNPGFFLRVDVWSKADTIQAPNPNGEIAAVNSLINRHIEEFVKDFSLANALPSVPADVNNINNLPPQKPQTSAKPKTSDFANATPDREVKPQAPPTDTPIQYSYVASKNSKVFHKPDCTWVKNILPNNRVFYKTRDEAIAAGKKPCKKCKP